MRPLNPSEVAEILHENERKVLAELMELEAATTDELSKATGLSRDAVAKASGWAETKGVVTFREQVSQFYSLLDEGQEYARHSLPERRLREMLLEGPASISVLKQGLPNINIALAWVRRNGWADIEKGVILAVFEFCVRKADDIIK